MRFRLFPPSEASCIDSHSPSTMPAAPCRIEGIESCCRLTILTDFWAGCPRWLSSGVLSVVRIAKHKVSQLWWEKSCKGPTCPALRFLIGCGALLASAADSVGRAWSDTTWRTSLSLIGYRGPCTHFLADAPPPLVACYQVEKPGLCSRQEKIENEMINMPIPEVTY